MCFILKHDCLSRSLILSKMVKRNPRLGNIQGWTWRSSASWSTCPATWSTTIESSAEPVGVFQMQIFEEWLRKVSRAFPTPHATASCCLKFWWPLCYDADDTWYLMCAKKLSKHIYWLVAQEHKLLIESLCPLPFFGQTCTSRAQVVLERVWPRESKKGRLAHICSWTFQTAIVSTLFQTFPFVGHLSCV